MELVLGLAALATAISSAGGANHVDSSPEIIEAETTNVVTTNEKIAEKAIDLPKSHIGDGLSGAGGSLVLPDVLLTETGGNSYLEENEYNDGFESANEIGTYNYTYSNYQPGAKPSN